MDAFDATFAMENIVARSCVCVYVCGFTYELRRDAVCVCCVCVCVCPAPECEFTSGVSFRFRVPVTGHLPIMVQDYHAALVVSPVPKANHKRPPAEQDSLSAVLFPRRHFDNNTTVVVVWQAKQGRSGLAR